MYIYIYKICVYIIYMFTYIQIDYSSSFPLAGDELSKVVVKAWHHHGLSRRRQGLRKKSGQVSAFRSESVRVGQSVMESLHVSPMMFPIKSPIVLKS